MQGVCSGRGLPLGMGGIHRRSRNAGWTALQTYSPGLAALTSPPNPLICSSQAAPGPTGISAATVPLPAVPQHTRITNGGQACRLPTVFQVGLLAGAAKEWLATRMSCSQLTQCVYLR